MRPPGVNGGKVAIRHRQLAGCIIAPAYNPPVIADAAGMLIARADGGKGAVRRVGLPFIGCCPDCGSNRMRKDGFSGRRQAYSCGDTAAAVTYPMGSIVVRVRR